MNPGRMPPTGFAEREQGEEVAMQLGALLPLGDIGGEPAVLRDYASAAEEIGYDFIEAPDHVLGVNAASRPGWDRNTSEDLFHDPFVLFGYLAGCTEKLGFSTGVLILAQRQAVLVAKQAACLDVLSGGKFRLGVGVGWNEVEFTGLNENFHNRGRRSAEQVQVMQALWASPHVSFKGKWHNIEDAGINPRPASGRVPVWFGGHHERTLERIAKWGDGWMPNAYAPGQEALDIFTKLRRMTEAAGRDPAKVGIEVWVSMGGGAEADWRSEAAFWKKAGATHLALTTTFNRRHHRRIAGRSITDHLAALRRYHAAIADQL
jgi:probable F420-dependent oxidoreductase